MKLVKQSIVASRLISSRDNMKKEVLEKEYINLMEKIDEESKEVIYENSFEDFLGDIFEKETDEVRDIFKRFITFYREIEVNFEDKISSLIKSNVEHLEPLINKYGYYLMANEDTKQYIKDFLKDLNKEYSIADTDEVLLAHFKSSLFNRDTLDDVFSKFGYYLESINYSFELYSDIMKSVTIEDIGKIKHLDCFILNEAMFFGDNYEYKCYKNDMRLYVEAAKLWLRDDNNETLKDTNGQFLNQFIDKLGQSYSVTKDKKYLDIFEELIKVALSNNISTGDSIFAYPDFIELAIEKDYLKKLGFRKRLMFIYELSKEKPEDVIKVDEDSYKISKKVYSDDYKYSEDIKLILNKTF